MISRQAALMMIGHMEWADSVVWASVLSTPSTSADSRIREKLYHLHAVQRAFLRLTQGERIDLPELESFPDSASVCTWARSGYEILLPFIRGLEDAAFVQTIEVPWGRRFAESVGREAIDPTVGEAIYQFTSHSAYHRGQVNTLLRELGAQPPLIDFIVWVWLEKPPAVWEAPV